MAANTIAGEWALIKAGFRERPQEFIDNARTFFYFGAGAMNVLTLQVKLIDDPSDALEYLKRLRDEVQQGIDVELNRLDAERADPDNDLTKDIE